MGIKYPIEYELDPRRVYVGTHWVTLKLKNIGADALKSLNVNLNSLDSYNLSVLGAGEFVAELRPNEEEMIPFQVSARRTTSVYVTVSGRRGGDHFYWESPTLIMEVGEEVAELLRLFVLSHPYTRLGETLEAEATILGKAESEGLRLEFWVSTPSGDFEELARIETKALNEGEEARYSAEFTTKEEGLYTVYAYLYHGDRILGRATDSALVTK